MANDELARLEWEIRQEQARFGATPPADDAPEELVDQPELTLGELLLGGALVGLVLAAIIGFVIVVVGLIGAALGKAHRDRGARR